MDFSVIIASRNRPQLVRQAIRSVLEQSHPSVELIVVNDGSDPGNAPGYAWLAQEFDGRVRVIDLPHLLRGHGSSYGYNRGVDAAAGSYICMLDDDDFWTDPEHLARAWKCLSAARADVYFSNQVAYLRDAPLPGPIWLEPVAGILERRGARPAPGDANVYAVTIDDLAQCGNFCHFNTTIVTRDLYLRLRGLNEFIRYENDRDFYLRLVGEARTMLFYAGTVSRHTVPDPTQSANASTSLPFLQKMLYRTYIFDKARTGNPSQAVRALATLHQSYTLRRIAERLLEEGSVRIAYRFALEALWTRVSVKWLFYNLYLGLRALAGGTAGATAATLPHARGPIPPAADRAHDLRAPGTRAIVTDFSVVIPSRNRPALLRDAIRSVLDQTHAAVEVIVVNDGSDGENAAAYAALRDEFAGRLRMVDLAHVAHGHGPSFAINRGADVAAGTYICLLDDDDTWSDPGHLARAWASLRATEGAAEVYFSNQAAYVNDTRLPGPIWLEPVKDLLERRGARMEAGAYPVSIADLLPCGNFCHFNTTIVSRDLYRRIGGMDKFIRYENDRDFYLRVIDKARRMLYYPGVVSRHNVPDPARTANASTAVPYLQKMVYRNYLWNKARLFSESALIRKSARLNVGYTLRRIAEALNREGRAGDAWRFARQALGAHFTWKWLGFCTWLGLRTIVAGFRRAAIDPLQRPAP